MLILQAFIPLSVSATQKYECLNHKNLLPLWASDTMAVGARLDWLPQQVLRILLTIVHVSGIGLIYCVLIRDLQLCLTILLYTFSREFLLQMGPK